MASEADAPASRRGPAHAAVGASRRETGARRGYDVRGLAIVFGDSTGAPKWPQDVRSHFQALCGRAGIGEDWTPASSGTRSSRCSSASGVDIEQIADAVGHVNSTVTRAVYRHQIADEITSAATVMDMIFGEAKGS